jgi:hypothetical protein
MMGTLASPAPLRLRPLEIGDLLDETFRMYRRHFFLFAGISVILSIPSAALSAYTVFALLGNLLQSFNPEQPVDMTALTSSLAVLGVGLLVSLALGPFTYGAVVYAVCESALGREVTLWGVLRGVWRRYWAIAGYVILMVLMGIAFCLFPLWIWIQVSWIAVMPLLFVENLGLTAAMGRSWRLVEGRWWRTFLILLLIFVLWYVVGIALGAVVQLASFLLQIVLSPVLSTAILSAVSELLQALATPILQIAIVLIYFDLRVRREGLDLFQLAQRVSALPA